MAKKVNKNDILKVLVGIVLDDKISGLQVDESNAVLFSISVDPKQGAAMEEMRQKAEEAIMEIKNVTKVTAILTAEKPVAASTQASDPHGMNKNPRLKLPIKKIIAVASGKGGVGKSTVAVNIAAQMAKTGLKVGLLDADIYGPSVPRLTGLPYEKPALNDEKKLIPFDAHGMKIMSIGFMVDQDTPMIWRGPMVQSGIYQMLRDVAWATDENPLDVLVIDMPPGTGDAQLTIAQKIDVDGAVIVSTPHDLALMDAIKAIEMFKKTDVKVLGLIENMSTHICRSCGHEEHIFGHGGVHDEAKKRDVSYLGSIPLERSIREDCDAGQLSDLGAYKEITHKVLAVL
jgi:ATP-binding protein involved in chromosome partitioning